MDNPVTIHELRRALAHLEVTQGNGPIPTVVTLQDGRSVILR